MKYNLFNLYSIKSLTLYSDSKILYHKPT